MRSRFGPDEFSFGPVVDWDDAYANSVNIPEGAGFPQRWTEKAAAFRAAARANFDIPYGAGPRERLDLFLPDGVPLGLFVFLHGGYWMLFAKEDWSHLAAGAVANGWAVALPTYSLCPEASLGDIAGACAQAIAVAAARTAGPIILCGHSAGGHLAARLVSTPSPLAPDVRSRITRVAPISGLFDLRPLMHTGMNATLRLDDAQARAESPALLSPPADVDLLAIVGADERPEFLRQSHLGAALWSANGAASTLLTLPGRHHFDVVEFLEDPASPVLARMLR